MENSVLFRGVRVKKGAVVKNCVLMQDTVVEVDAQLDCVVTDKNVTHHRRQEAVRYRELPRLRPEEPHRLMPCNFSQGRLPPR